MNKLTGQGLADFAISKLGTPYVYGAKGANGKFTQSQLSSLSKAYPSMFTNTYITKAKRLIGKICCDCSGLISWYTGKELGSYQLYSTASKRGLISGIDKAPIGAVLWHPGHVGIYIGNGYCMEEKGIDYGCVKSKLSNTTFTHWLLFNYIDYDDIADTNVKTTHKESNPYTKPTSSVHIGDNGENVKWVQYELAEAGFSLKIDGDFGPKTLAAAKDFQQSCKIDVDGIVGPKTISKLINN
jgi:hypothetical protein